MRGAVVLLGFLLVGCASRVAGGDDGRAQWSQRIMVACFRDQAASMDDGRSDARTVGAAVLAACRPQVDAVILAGGAHLSPAAARQYERQTRAGLVDYAAQAVLIGRRQARER
jgi:hypothetical protein